MSVHTFPDAEHAGVGAFPDAERAGLSECPLGGAAIVNQDTLTNYLISSRPVITLLT